jgi:putative PIN family toxin of toxin-antitoxin system
MIGVTADANIYISGFEFGGLPERFLQLARNGAFRLDISESIKREVLRVLREKFGYPTPALLATEVQIDRITHRVNPTQQVDFIKTDPSDNRILECVIAAKSDFIVSGDTRHVLPLGSFEGIEIIRLADFMERLSHRQEL